ncbi:hypothetical protein KQX54_020593 [Cotesia glomerata]|uniref:Uncharacterized protein n=1 Tax=Cotesia glomerata TaxID=32391 RepID=A0AAV7I4R5_COTGL|nr:hypothetical protein KQX54_020593 [Cotesia glomerata]
MVVVIVCYFYSTLQWFTMYVGHTTDSGIVYTNTQVWNSMGHYKSPLKREAHVWYWVLGIYLPWLRSPTSLQKNQKPAATKIHDPNDLKPQKNLSISNWNAPKNPTIFQIHTTGTS